MRYSISFIIRYIFWVFNYWINPHFIFGEMGKFNRFHYQLFEYWWQKILSDVWILMIETNLDSIILRKLEIFVNWDLSIIGRVRLVKKTRQSWWHKVGAILKVVWHYKIKLNWIVLTTVRFVQQQNGQLSSTQLQLQSRKWTVILLLYILTTCHL